jgi:hypothetical protein
LIVIAASQSYPKHLFALGYGSNGMTFEFLAARLLGELAPALKND